MPSQHFRDWRALAQFHPNATVRLLTNINPWSGGSARGCRMWDEVLAPNPVSTVHQLEKLKDELGVPDEGYGAKGHLGWLYTWSNKPGFPFVEIDGQTLCQTSRATRPTQSVAPSPASDQADLAARVDALFEAVAAIRREITLISDSGMR